MTTAPAQAGDHLLVRTLVDATGSVITGVAREDVENRLQSGGFFWLDLPSVGDEELSWLRDLFHFHPLAIEDAEHFRQRPKLDEYDGYVVLILYGSGAEAAAGDDSLDSPGSGCSPDVLESVSEVHCFVSGKYVVTVHRGNCPAFLGLVKRLQVHSVIGEGPGHLFYRLADTLVDSFFPVLSDLDDKIDALQAAVIDRPTNDQLGQLLAYKGSLITLRRVITPQRDLFASLAGGVTFLPGLDVEAQRYFRDVYDHLIRLSDLVDSYRDLLSGTTDAYLSVVSNQLNRVMKQLTIIATIFLPLSFLTGFFGQNFAWLVRHLGSFWTFVVLGLGTEVVAVTLLLSMFYRRGWLGNQT
jgi:magnesium transporter